MSAPGLANSDLAAVRRVLLAQEDDATGRRLLGELKMKRDDIARPD